MSITAETATEIGRAIRRGLRTLEKPEPLRLSQWADEHFYLSAESSYIEGRWEAVPYQVAVMDAISNDDIRSVTVMKSARVGYTKMIVAAIGYFAEHKRRNQVVFQPVDDDADDFVKDEIEPMLRDVPAVQRVFPHYSQRSKLNTLRKKVFAGSTLDIRGGKAAKNYRRLSKDVVFFDELDGFDTNVGKEGDPIKLGEKRIEGATFPKSVRGSTPKKKGASLIERCHDEAEERFKFHVPCPHCQHEQPLRWGDPDTPFGMKWQGDDPSTVEYLCEKCASLFAYEDYLAWCLPRGRWVSDAGVWIDGDGYFRAASGELVPTPEHVAFHIWTAYSTMVAWSKIVDEFLKARKSRDTDALQTFVNTTLGESWDEDPGERTDADTLIRRREQYGAEVPEGVIAIVVGVDTQDDRFELQFDGYGAGEERWSIDYVRLYGDPSRQELWDKLETQLRRTFVRADGTMLQPMLACQDHGGHYSDEVNAFSKRMGLYFLIPTKGSSERGQPVAMFPRKRNAKGVYLTLVGSDTAKSLLHQRYQIADHGPGYVHWAMRDCFDNEYFAQVTAEQRVKRYERGVARFVWDAKGRRNEATDCSVLTLAAIRIAQQHFGVDLSVAPPTPIVPPPRPRDAGSQERPRSGWLGNRSGWLRR